MPNNGFGCLSRGIIPFRLFAKHYYILYFCGNDLDDIGVF